MKQFAKLSTYGALVLVSAISGWQLTYVIEMLPVNMPYPIDMFIRFCLSATGNSDLANPDDMEVLALLLYWAIASLLVGVLLFLCGKAVRRYHAGKIGSR
jgi:hypothetical protein